VLVERANLAGGHDNVTVIVACFDGAGLASPSPDDEPLKYRKYPLPEEPMDAADGGRMAPSTVKPAEQPKLGADVKSSSVHPSSGRVTDHGPSRSKVAHTLVGAQLGADAIAAIERASLPASEPAPSSSPDDEPIHIPEDAAPGWMVSALVVGTLCLVAVLAFYLLR
jgi:protein phosphatase